MNEANRVYTDEELLAEIVGFLPKRPIDEFYNSMNVAFARMIEGLLVRLKQLAPDKEVELDKALDDFAKHCEVELDHVFNILQQYIYDNVWRIEKGVNVLPAHYKELPLDVSEENEDLIKQETQKLKKQLLAQKAYQKMLSNDIAKKEKELEKLNEYYNLIDGITSLPDKEKYQSPLELVNTLKHNLEELKKSTLASIMTSKEVSKTVKDTNQRTHYLRESLKRHLDVFILPVSKRNKPDHPL